MGWNKNKRKDDGSSSTRLDGTRLEPSGQRICWAGAKCKWKDCAFWHPSDWNGGSQFWNQEGKDGDAGKDGGGRGAE